MTVFPIVERELRVAARQRATYGNRLSAAVLALVIGGIVMLIPEFDRPHQMGMAMFSWLSVLAFIYAVLGGLMSTSDCISEEKREGTLGLLFLTDLRGYDIIAGKLVATSLNVFYGILAIFPVMAIPLLLGGVSANEFWRVNLTVVNNLFFSLAVGMWVSSISTNERRAMLACFCILLFFTGGLPLLGGILSDWSRHPTILAVCLVPSPGFACFMAFDAFNASPFSNAFYWSTGCVHVMAWLFLGAASLIVPRTWKDKPSGSSNSKQNYGFWKRLGLGSAKSRPRMRTRFLNINPYFWLSARDRLGIFWIWAFIFAGAFIWLFGYAINPRDWGDEPVLVLFAIIYHLVLRVWLASESCRRFSTDRSTGGLELILVTPLPVRRIIGGQLRALRRHFLFPILFVLTIDVLCMLSDSRDGDWVAFWMCGMVVFLGDLLAIPWVGMWAGLNSKNTGRAIGACLVRILVLPMVVLLSFWILVLITTRGRGMGDSLFYVTWILASLGFAFAFGYNAYDKLHRLFRTVATQRFEKKKEKDSAPPVS